MAGTRWDTAASAQRVRAVRAESPTIKRASRSGLVPRRAAWLGVIGGPLIILSGTAVMFTGNDPSNALHSLQAIVTIPEFLWELFLGIYCTFKGFRPSSPILQADARGDRVRGERPTGAFRGRSQGAE